MIFRENHLPADASHEILRVMCVYNEKNPPVCVDMHSDKLPSLPGLAHFLDHAVP